MSFDQALRTGFGLILALIVPIGLLVHLLYQMRETKRLEAIHKRQHENFVSQMNELLAQHRNATSTLRQKMTEKPPFDRPN